MVVARLGLPLVLTLSKPAVPVFDI